MVLLALWSAGTAVAAPTPLSRTLAPGEAVVWYLNHSGWAVRTANHILVFDPTEPLDAPPVRSLDTGFVDPGELADRDVTVFVSHRHGDHYDPSILDWRSRIERIRYVWGWEGAGDAGDIHFGPQRRSVTIDGLEVLNVHHAFDGIPESAFLVRADGVTILHAGDHGHRNGIDNPVFADNLRYLAGEAPRLDLLFTPDFGGALDAVRVLHPRVVFPMHAGGHERELAGFADAVRRMDGGSGVGVARRPGDPFLYSGGGIVSLLPARLEKLILDKVFLDAEELAVRLLDGVEPPRPETRTLCGLALLQAGSVARAETVLAEALAAAPGNPEAHLGLGRIARMRNESDAAIAHLRAAATSGVFYEEALRWLWRAAREQGRVDEVIAIHDMARRRYESASRRLPGWFVNGYDAIERLAGERLYAMEAGSKPLRLPLGRSGDADNRTVELRLDGKGVYPFDIDSASPEFVTISPLLAEDLGLAPAGSSSAVGVGSASAPVRFAMLDRVEVGPVVFTNVPVMVSDLFTFRGKKKGILGTGLLKRFNVTIDVAAGVMDLFPLDRPDLLRAAIDPALVALDVPLLVFDATTVEAVVEGAPPSLYVLDTAASTHLLDIAFFERHLRGGLDPSRIQSRTITGAQGAQQTDRVEGLSIALGPLVLDRQGMHLFPMDRLNSIGSRYTAGLLGYPLLWPYRVHMDFRNGRLILERRAPDGKRPETEGEPRQDVGSTPGW